MKLEKRAQHEMVGFVLIVVIVVVLGMFLLMFYLKKPVETQSRDIESFLESSMLYTTECSISFPRYDNLQELIKHSYQNKKCANDKMAFEVLNETLSELLHNIWIDRERTRAYSYSLEYDTGTRHLILNLKEGSWSNCTNKGGAEYLFPHLPGNMVASMEVCYR